MFFLGSWATALAVLQNIIKWLEVITTKGEKASTIHQKIKHYYDSSQIEYFGAIYPMLSV